MLNFTAMIQGIDTIFTNLIFIPALLILYLKFRPRKPWSRRTRNLYRLCIALISVYVIRIFCAGFIFTPVNYSRFADSGFFPCKLRSNGMPVPLLRNGYSIFNGTKYR